MKDIELFHSCIDCLIIEKNKVKDKKILKMSYMKFLVFLIYGQSTNEEKDIQNMWLYKVNKLFSLIFQEQKWEFRENTETNCIYLYVNDIQINDLDFDNVRKLVCKQNLIRLEEEILDEEMEEALKSAEEFMRKRNNPATLEENIVAYRCAFHESYENIKNLTIYQFNKDLERMSILKSWEIYTYPALKGGEQNSLPQHWLSHIQEKGQYDDVTMGMDEFGSMANNLGINTSTIKNN
jgi:hypothetical protein